MTTTREKVHEFNTAFGVPMSDRPNNLSLNPKLKVELVREEIVELVDAFTKGDRVEIADALGDIMYVVEGAGLDFGYEIPDTGFLTHNLHSNNAAGELIGRMVWYIHIIRLDVDDYHSEEDRALQIQLMLAEIKHSVTLIAEQLRIPLDEVIAAIHESNMSKLGEDGKPIYRESDRKVLKGPNYFTPTARIKEILGVAV